INLESWTGTALMVYWDIQWRVGSNVLKRGRRGSWTVGKAKIVGFTREAIDYEAVFPAVLGGLMAGRRPPRVDRRGWLKTAGDYAGLQGTAEDARGPRE